MARDFDKRPYSPDEKRVAEWFFEKGIGGGDDPIGGLLAMHEYIMGESRNLKEKCAVKAETVPINTFLTDGVAGQITEARCVIAAAIRSMT